MVTNRCNSNVNYEDNICVTDAPFLLMKEILNEFDFSVGDYTRRTVFEGFSYIFSCIKNWDFIWFEFC